jgi:uncharacterized Zn-finger protein
MNEDLPDVPYTINDVTEVVCPYCHENMGDMNEDLPDVPCAEADVDCSHCGHIVHLVADVQVSVTAWKPEAME